MTKHDQFLARRFEPIGKDSDHFAWRTPSWTRKGVEHEIWLSKRDGEIICYCEHSQCRKRIGHVLDDPATTHGCKHIRALLRMLEGTIGA